MKSLLIVLVMSLVGVPCLFAQASVPINTIATSHPTEVIPPPASTITVEGRWQLTKYTRTPPVVALDSEFGVIMALVTPEHYVAQVVCKDDSTFGTSRKQAHGNGMEFRKYTWTPHPIEHQPGASGGSGSIRGRMNLSAWIELASGEGSASLQAALRVTSPELAVDAQMMSAHIRTTQKKTIGRVGAAGGVATVSISVDTALRNGFYPGPPINPTIFSGSSDGLTCCSVLQAAAVTIEAFANGHFFSSAAVRAFGQGGSFYKLELG